MSGNMINKGLRLTVDALENSNSVHFVIRLSNNTDSGKNIEFRTSQKYEIYVMNSQGKEVYRYSKGRMFTQAIENVHLPSGESLTWKETWDYISEGKRIEPGEYRVMVNLVGKTEDGKIHFAMDSFIISNQLDLEQRW